MRGSVTQLIIKKGLILLSILFNYNISPMEIKRWFEEVLPYPIRWTGFQGYTRCPFHNDDKPSFSANYEDGVWNCHAGCGSGGLNDLADRLGVKSLLKREEDYLEAKFTPNTTYDYTDEQGRLLYRVCRKYPKGFYQQRPDGKGGWINNLKGITRVPYRLSELLKAIKDKKVVFVVEGEKDVDNLNKLGLTATTNAQGAGKWPKDEYFNRYFSGGEIVIIPDNDDPGRRHALQVASALHSFCKSLKVMELPELREKGDVSDWLALGRAKNDLLELVTGTKPWNPSEEEGIVFTRGKSEKLMKAINFRDKYSDGGKFSPPMLAEEILEEHNFFYYDQQLFFYEKGVYRPTGHEAIGRLCKEKLGTEFRKHRVEEVIYYIKTATKIDPTVINQDDGLINVKNGNLNWRTGELLSHTPKRLSTIQLPVAYDRDADCPAISKFFKEVLPEDSISVIEELVGYSLTPTSKYEKAFMFTGTGANGKSVMINLLSKLIGQQNTTSIPFQELISSKYKRADLYGTLLNACADLSTQAASSSEIFKKIVSGDVVDAERKFGHPFYFRPTASLVFSANAVPGARDITYAFFRRWIIVPFPNRFEHGKNADENLINKLTMPKELSGLLNLAIKGLQRLEANKCFTETDATRTALAQYQINTDSVMAFTEEECAAKEYVRVYPQALYDAYMDWCNKTGFRPKGRNKFYDRLKEIYPDIEEKKAQQGGRRYWSGIGLKCL